MSTPATSAGAARVSTLELFFDLVFVFTITQLTTVLADEPTLVGLAKIFLMLGVIWWMYGAYAWLTNAVPPDVLVRRLLLILGMAGFLVMALAIPQAFSGRARRGGPATRRGRCRRGGRGGARSRAGRLPVVDVLRRRRRAGGSGPPPHAH